MNIACIGPPGSGKGTLALQLAPTFSLDHVSTGNLFRRHLVRKTALGLLSRKYMVSGELVPDEVVDAMMQEWLEGERTGSGALFDGFPRTLYQAHFLDAMLEELGTSLDAVVYIDVPDTVALDRLLDRLICRACQAPFHLRLRPPATAGACDHCGGTLYHRHDDAPELIANRLHAFHRVTSPVLDHYHMLGKLMVADAIGDANAVGGAVQGLVEGLRSGKPSWATVDEVALLKEKSEAPMALAADLVLHPTTDIVLLGAPGSGKGTQAEHICADLSLPHVATGDLFRENLRNETPLGKTAKAYMDQGELVPDEVTDAMVNDRLGRPDVGAGFVLDGYPRNVQQAESLTAMENAMGRRISRAICINVPDDEIVNRLSGRLICRHCQAPFHRQFKAPKEEGVCDACGGELYQRDDDNPETVRARLNIFHKQTQPVIDYYRAAGLLVEVEGEGELDEVRTRTIEAARAVREEVRTTN